VVGDGYAMGVAAQIGQHLLGTGARRLGIHHPVVVFEHGEPTSKLVAGKTAQEFNRRKDRKGAFWEDRYHATAVETGEHCLRCLVYIDLNMVRNGVVPHPSAWPHGGYNEIQAPPKRYALINRENLIVCCGAETDRQLRERHRQWIEDAIGRGSNVRQPRWTESIAVGSEGFVEGILQKPGLQAKGRKVRDCVDHYELREPEAVYGGSFPQENPPLRAENEYYWKQIGEQSVA